MKTIILKDDSWRSNYDNWKLDNPYENEKNIDQQEDYKYQEADKQYDER